MSKPIHIEKKSRDLLKNSPEALRILRTNKADGRWVSSDELARAGVPLDLCAPVLLYLASRLGADVRFEKTLQFRFKDLSRAPWTLGLPARIQGLAHKIDRVARHSAALMTGLVVSTVGSSVGFFYLYLVSRFADESTQSFVMPMLGLPTLMFFLPIGVSMGVFGFAIGILVFVAEAIAKGRGDDLILVPILIFVQAIYIAILVGEVFPALLKLFYWLQNYLKNIINFGTQNSGPLEDEQTFLELVQARKGIIQLGDLMVLFGWSKQQAFDELTQLMLDYGGDVDVDDDGRLCFEFNNSLKSFSTQGIQGSPPPIWEREERPSVVFDAAARRADWFYLGFWALALLGPGLVLLPSEALAGDEFSISALGLVFVFPIYVPVRRWVVSRRDRAYSKRLEVLHLMRTAKENSGRIRASIDQFDSGLLVDLGGEVLEETAEDGEVTFFFSELTKSITPQ